MRSFALFCILFLSLTAMAQNPTDLRTFGEPSQSNIYLFTSPSCPHCRDFHKTIFPELIKRYINTKRAQLFIVDMPYDENALHASMLLRCLPPDKSQKMMGWLYENQARWVDAKDPTGIFSQYAQTLGFLPSAFNACLSNEALEDALIEQRDQLSTLYKVRGWPTTVLRQGNAVKHYVGTNKKAILTDMEKDIKDFEKKQQLGIKAK